MGKRKRNQQTGQRATEPYLSRARPPGQATATVHAAMSTGSAVLPEELPTASTASSDERPPTTWVGLGLGLGLGLGFGFG